MEKTYGIRISFNHGNDITLDLKGCGLLHIKPGKDYYFINAPIEFTTYLAQLRRLGITYKITSDRKGCFQTLDLTSYFKNDAREILKNLRKANVINEDNYLNEDTKKAKHIKPERKVVLSSDDLIETKEVVVEAPQEVKPEEANNNEVNNIITEVTETEALDVINESTDENVETETQNETETGTQVDKEPPKVYSEEEIRKMSKNDLLELANSYGIKEVSEINTKKEIREAILEKIKN